LVEDLGRDARPFLDGGPGLQGLVLGGVLAGFEEAQPADLLVPAVGAEEFIGLFPEADGFRGERDLARVASVGADPAVPWSAGCPASGRIGLQEGDGQVRVACEEERGGRTDDPCADHGDVDGGGCGRGRGGHGVPNADEEGVLAVSTWRVETVPGLTGGLSP
jgi:hypothetical protein